MKLDYPDDTKCATGCFIAYWFTIIEMVLLLIILCIIQIWLLCCFYFPSLKHAPSKSEINKINNFFKISVIISIFFSMISVIFDLVHIVDGYRIPKPLHKDTFHGIRAGADFSMFMSLLTFYIYLYKRLTTAFDGTVFKLKKRFRISTYIIFVILIILNLWYTALLTVDAITKFEVDIQFYSNMHSVIWALMSWFYMVLFLLVVIVFIYKLRQLTIYSYSVSDFSANYIETQISSAPPSPNITPVAFSDNPSTPNINDSSSSIPAPSPGHHTQEPSGAPRASSIGASPDTHIEELILVVTKQTNLSLMAFIVFMFRFIYRAVVGFYDEDVVPEILWMVSYAYRDILLLFNTFVMYLGFKFNEGQYKLCCKYCHKGCRSLCVWSMDKKTKSMQEKRIKEQNLQKQQDQEKNQSTDLELSNV